MRSAASIKALRLGAFVVVAFILALASSTVQRYGPDHGVYCALGKSADGFDIYCPKPKLNGGWPAPFIFDRAGITVEDKLFIEDDFRWAPFMADTAFYLVLLMAAAGFWQCLRTALARQDRQ